MSSRLNYYSFIVFASCRACLGVLGVSEVMVVRESTLRRDSNFLPTRDPFVSTLLDFCVETTSLRSGLCAIKATGVGTQR
jgi:hypothetical protein